jgi:hypothetical protein
LARADTGQQAEPGVGRPALGIQRCRDSGSRPRRTHHVGRSRNRALACGGERNDPVTVSGDEPRSRGLARDIGSMESPGRNSTAPLPLRPCA